MVDSEGIHSWLVYNSVTMCQKQLTPGFMYRVQTCNINKLLCSCVMWNCVRMLGYMLEYELLTLIFPLNSCIFNKYLLAFLAHNH